MDTIHINVMAIVLAVISNMVLGYLWYMPQLFGKEWMKMNGLTKKQTETNRSQPMIAMLLLAVIEAYVMKHFVVFVGAYYISNSAISIGFMTGLWIWIGFVLPALGASYMFAQRRKKLLAIDAGYYLVALPIMGMILTHWA